MTTHPPKEARFTLIVKKFKDIFTTPIRNRGTLYRIKMEKPRHPLVHAKYKKGYVKSIIIDPGRVTLRFRVIPADNDKKNQYSPVGIAFVRKASKSLNKLSKVPPIPEIFPPHEMKLDEQNRAVSVTAEFSGSRSADEGKYEFFLIIQRDRYGNLGIIDPPLDHEH
jgi:hypothetical protein